MSKKRPRSKKVKLFNYLKKLKSRDSDAFFELYKSTICDLVKEGKYRIINGEVVIMSSHPISWVILRTTDKRSVACITEFSEKIKVIHIDSYTLFTMGFNAKESQSVLYHELGHLFSENVEKRIIEKYGNIEYGEQEFLADVYNTAHDPEAAVSALEKTKKYYIELRKNNPERVTEYAITAMDYRIKMMIFYIEQMKENNLEPCEETYELFSSVLENIIYECREDKTKK